MPGEPLGEEEILRSPIDVRDGRVAERVEVVVGLEARIALPADEDHVDAPQAQPAGHARRIDRGPVQGGNGGSGRLDPARSPRTPDIGIDPLVGRYDRRIRRPSETASLPLPAPIRA
jgi:hypothetical protein